MFLDVVEKLNDRQIGLATWLVFYIEERITRGQGPPDDDTFINDLADDIQLVMASLGDALMKGTIHAENEPSH